MGSSHEPNFGCKAVGIKAALLASKGLIEIFGQSPPHPHTHQTLEISISIHTRRNVNATKRAVDVGIEGQVHGANPLETLSDISQVVSSIL